MDEESVKNRSQYDTTLKDLFEQPPQRLLQLLVGCNGVQLLTVEFASTQKRLPDLVFLLEDDAIFHLELQSSSEGMDWRMLMYYALIRQRHPTRKLVQKVLYVGLERWQPKPVIAEQQLNFSYEVVDIRDIDCREMLESPALEENILAILCHTENARDTIREVLRRIAELPPKARNDALTKLFVLSRLRKLETTVKEEAEEMALTFNVMENDVLRPLFLKAQQESLFEGEQRGLQIGKQEGLQIGKQEGLQIGEQRGLQIGKQEGLRDGAMRSLLRLIQRRFGPAPEWVHAKLAGADLELLGTWTERILDAKSLDDIFQ